jgi:DNA primase
MKVLELIKKLGYQYNEKGNDYIVKCINPEHDDTHPSMRIDKITGIYNCFSCGYSGNLLRENGVILNKVDVRSQRILNKIKDFRKPSLDMPIGSTPYITPFRGISSETLQYFEAFIHPDFESRIVFPLRDFNNDIAVFIGRHLHTKTADKYLFVPKGIDPPLFPAKPIAIYENSIILVEGIFDAINLIDKGLQNAICAFGTTTLYSKKKRKLKQEKLEYLKVMGVDTIYIMFDGDKAGKEASQDLEDLINSSGLFSAERIELPDGVDPGDLDKTQIKYIKENLYP